MTRNIAKCRRCKTIIESLFRHDFRRCECGAIFVDGGNDYHRYGGEPTHFDVITPNELAEYDLQKKGSPED